MGSRDAFGTSIVLDGQTVIVGATGEDTAGLGANTGIAYVYQFLGRADCAGNGVNDVCEPDCNLNGIHDACDLADLTSDDCNLNQIPDECESNDDCNANGARDMCDIVLGTSEDCNFNGIPDECDLGGPPQDLNGDGYHDHCRFPRIFLAPRDADPIDYPAGPTMLNASGLQGSTLELAIYVQYLAQPVVALESVLPCDATGGEAGTVQVINGLCDPAVPQILFRSTTPHTVREPTILGFLDLEISPDSEGTFTFDFGQSARAYVNSFTTLSEFTGAPLILSLGCPPSTCTHVSECTCAGLTDCTLATCVDGQCSYRPRVTGDADGNGSIDVQDILCVLDGFRGLFSHCSFEDVDIEPCEPDDIIDLFDILAVLKAFEGAAQCISACGHGICEGSCNEP